MKSVRIRSYSGPHFPVFGLNVERYSVSLRIQSECGKMQARITPNTDTFYVAQIILIMANILVIGSERVKELLISLNVQVPYIKLTDD